MMEYEMSNFMSSKEERGVYREESGRRNARSFSSDSQKQTTKERLVRNVRSSVLYSRACEVLANDDRQLMDRDNPRLRK